MRVKLILRLTAVVLTCLVLWAGVVWLLPASQTVRANPGFLFVTVTGTGTACSQAQPCDLQTALARAGYDDVYVAAGTYTGSGAAVATLPNGIALYGGWNGAPSGPIVRDPGIYRSILDGEGERRVVFAGSGVAFTLDGFTIQRGFAETDPARCLGGGVYSEEGWPWIINNIITGNIGCSAPTGLAWPEGGGIFVGWTAHPALIQGNHVLNNAACGSGPAAGGGIAVYVADKAKVLDNIVQYNTATKNGSGYGGGVSVVWSDGAELTNNLVADNFGCGGDPSTEGRGGGVYIERSQAVTLSGNSVADNIAALDGSGYGGGVCAIWADELYLVDGYVQSNYAAYTPDALSWGGALHVSRSHDIVIGDNRISHNTTNPTAGSGGAVSIGVDTSFLMANNIISENWAGSTGGGVQLTSYEGEFITGTMLHNTLVANDWTGDDAGVAVYLSTPGITLGMVNNLLCAHSSGVYAASGSEVALVGTLFYANTSSDTAGDGTITNDSYITGLDPRLDATYHLLPGSPAIDAGVDSGLLWDIDGDARPLADGFDIGADEYTEPHHVFLPVALKRR